jgi:hypothetical protein
MMKINFIGKNDILMKDILFTIIAFIYSLNCFAQEQLIPYRQNNKWGFASIKREIIVQPKYDSVGFFNYGLAWVKKGRKYGYIDNKGEVVIKIQYSKVDNFWNDGIAIVEYKGKKYSINKTGEKTDKNHQYGCESPGIILSCGDIIKPEKMIDYILKSPYKNEIIEFDWDTAKFIPHDLFFSLLKEKMKTIKKVGYVFTWCGSFSKDTIPPIYDQIQSVETSRLFIKLLVKLNDKWGIINNKNEIVLPIIYDTIALGNYYSLSAIIVLNGKYGYIDSSGNIIIKPKYKSAGHFSNGVAKVKAADNKFGYIDIEGNEYWDWK